MKETNYDQTQFTKDTLSEAQTALGLAAYFPSDELVKAVEIARILQRPLLLRGEPGCGKTKLASALAYAIHSNQFKKGVNYFEWHIKSTSKAKEGLYEFDHMARLRDVQSNQEKEPEQYLKFGPIGSAFKASSESAPAVLLIDEIDKADIDFPNDLLLELDEKRFVIPEVLDVHNHPTEIKAKYPPIVIITSNDEKQLPNAFLRRCVFHYIDFPSEAELVKIVEAKTQEEGKNLSVGQVLTIVKKFTDLYNRMKQQTRTDKSPSTSELLDVVALIHYYEQEFNESEKLEDYFVYALLKTYDDVKLMTGKK
jgi:MoxR-like ATPase